MSFNKMISKMTQNNDYNYDNDDVFHFELAGCNSNNLLERLICRYCMGIKKG